MKASKGSVTVGEIGLVLILVASIAFLVIRHNRQKAERIQAEQAQLAAEAEAVKAKAEREMKEKARLEQQARLEEERKARQKAEEEKRRQDEEERLAREKEAAEIIDRASKTLEGDHEISSLPEDDSFWTARHRVLKLRFKDAEVGYIGDVGVDDNPAKVSKRTVFWYVDESFAKDGTIYELEAVPGSLRTVYALRENGHEKVLDTSAFAKEMYSGVGVLMRGNRSWVCGTGKRVRTIPLPARGTSFSPQAAELKPVKAILEALQCQPPHRVKYKISLRNVAGETVSSVAVVESDGELPSNKIDEVLTKVLVRLEKERRGASTVKRPRLKTFRPTVVFYDGVHIKKDSKGVISVPRTFQHLGTAVNHMKEVDTVDDFRRKWENLRREAERQEKVAEEVDEENRARLARYEEQLAQIADVVLTDEEVDRNRSSYSLQVERLKD